jgi:hypothetical protein
VEGVGGLVAQLRAGRSVADLALERRKKRRHEYM